MVTNQEKIALWSEEDVKQMIYEQAFKQCWNNTQKEKFSFETYFCCRPDMICEECN